ncbi:hypothetical protein AgCh_002913 [Apium graveolens]
MKSHLKGLGLWTWVESEREIQPLTNNPTLNQIKLHEDESSKGPRALSIIHTAVSESIFTRIMACETGKEAWDKVKELYEGNTRIKRMQVLNLKRDFETLAMKEKDTLQDYYDNLMGVVNKMRLMREYVLDRKIVEKLFVSLPESGLMRLDTTAGDGCGGLWCLAGGTVTLTLKEIRKDKYCKWLCFRLEFEKGK